MAKELERSSARRARRARWVVVAAVLAGGGIAWAAGELSVGVPKVEILSRKNGFGAPLATLNKGETLSVVAEEGDWLKVRAPGGKDGYVKKAALTAPVLTAGGRPVTGDARAGGLDAGNAAKGIERAAEDYAEQNRIDPAGLMYALSQRKALENNPAVYEEFLQAGLVGAAKRR